MTIKLYGMTSAVCTGRVLLTLWEKNVDYEFVTVDMFKKEHKSAEYKKHQPFGQIPYMVDGDLELFESRAIARVVCEKYADQGTPLYGTTPNEKAMVEQWLEVEAQNYNPPISTLLYDLIFGPFVGKPIPDESVIAGHKAKLEAVLDIYEKRLSESKYLAGDFFSLADLSHITYTWSLINLCQLGSLYDSRPHVRAWLNDLLSRPSAKRWAEGAIAAFTQASK